MITINYNISLCYKIACTTFTSRSDDFAAAVLDEANDDGGSSEFDDFSDGDEQVNIIKVVNGIPSPVPPPTPPPAPPAEEEEEAEAVVAGGRLSRAESSPSPGMDSLPSFILSCPYDQDSPWGTRLEIPT